MRIVLELEKGVNQNAASYFEKAKKLKKKIEGIKKALITFDAKLEKKNIEIEKKQKIQEKIEKESSRKKEWYEKFRWFISSDNFLVIGGKDSGTNEIVIKKHTDKDDVVFHTEVSGSPFVVVKNPEKKIIPQTTKDEAAVFCLTFSKAWSLEINSREVYEVSPEQVTKKAKSGEYLSKGGFMIYGERKYYNPTISLAVGLLKNKKHLMSGPVSAVKKNCDKIIVLKSGNLKKGEISKSLMKLFGIHTNDDLLSMLPAGKFSIAKESKK